MNVEAPSKRVFCFHLEKRLIERVSKGVFIDKRPDLVIWVCHFPLPSLSGIQCPVATGGAPCPHSGPYGNN
jgi:hypothetical protein